MAMRRDRTAFPPADPDPLLAVLEPNQLVLGRRPLSRRTLETRHVFLLTVLRIYVIVAVALVVYAFLRALHA